MDQPSGESSPPSREATSPSETSTSTASSHDEIVEVRHQNMQIAAPQADAPVIMSPLRLAPQYPAPQYLVPPYPAPQYPEMKFPAPQQYRKQQYPDLQYPGMHYTEPQLMVQHVGYQVCSNQVREMPPFQGFQPFLAPPFEVACSYHPASVGPCMPVNFPQQVYTHNTPFIIYPPAPVHHTYNPPVNYSFNSPANQAYNSAVHHTYNPAVHHTYNPEVHHTYKPVVHHTHNPEVHHAFNPAMGNIPQSSIAPPLRLTPNMRNHRPPPLKILTEASPEFRRISKPRPGADDPKDTHPLMDSDGFSVVIRLEGPFDSTGRQPGLFLSNTKHFALLVVQRGFVFGSRKVEVWGNGGTHHMYDIVGVFADDKGWFLGESELRQKSTGKYSGIVEGVKEGKKRVQMAPVVY